MNYSGFGYSGLPEEPQPEEVAIVRRHLPTAVLELIDQPALLDSTLKEVFATVQAANAKARQEFAARGRRKGWPNGTVFLLFARPSSFDVHSWLATMPFCGFAKGYSYFRHYDRLGECISLKPDDTATTTTTTPLLPPPPFAALPPSLISHLQASLTGGRHVYMNELFSICSRPCELASRFLVHLMATFLQTLPGNFNKEASQVPASSLAKGLSTEKKVLYGGALFIIGVRPLNGCSQELAKAAPVAAHQAVIKSRMVLQAEAEVEKMVVDGNEEEDEGDGGDRQQQMMID